MFNQKQKPLSVPAKGTSPGLGVSECEFSMFSSLSNSEEDLVGGGNLYSGIDGYLDELIKRAKIPKAI